MGRTSVSGQFCETSRSFLTCSLTNQVVVNSFYDPKKFYFQTKQRPARIEWKMGGIFLRSDQLPHLICHVSDWSPLEEEKLSVAEIQSIWRLTEWHASHKEFQKNSIFPVSYILSYLESR